MNLQYFLLCGASRKSDVSIRTFELWFKLKGDVLENPQKQYNPQGWAFYLNTFFSLGLLCLYCSCPLINMPLPGNAPLQFVSPLDGYKVPPSLSLNDLQDTSDGDVKLPRWVSNQYAALLAC